ncbi:MAG: NAD(P)H-hydrate epimerase [Tabrizicola sp.]|nr:NAD(P)H-hydrate epimerase [Tabrizicola sp.]
MTELLTAAQMRAIEQAVIASGEVTGLELMERAGRGVVEAIFEEWPEMKATSHRAVVLCGPGNNGGDGFVVARLLKEWGWEVEVFLYGDPERLPPDARANYERWVGMGEVAQWDDYAETLKRHKYSRDVREAFPGLRDATKADLFIDALFGTGLSRAVNYGDLVGMFLASSILLKPDGKSVCLDVPTGICAESGRALGDDVAAVGYPDRFFDLCVTFQSNKPGNLLAEGGQAIRKLRVVDLGLGKAARKEGMGKLVEVDLAWIRLDHMQFRLGVVGYKRLSKSRMNVAGQSGPADHHKYSHGHALILSGQSGRGGAARLAARGALRIGAGVVTVGCPPEAIPENAARLDAVMLRGVADGLALEEALADPRINALCVGPGLGLDARGLEVVAVALGASPGSPPPPSPPHAGEGGRLGQGAAQDDQALPLPPVGRGEGRGASSRDRRKIVLDADALTILSQHPDLFAALHKGCVLTPHAGEFARLFPDIAEKLAAPATKGPAYSKVDATREAAKRAGCVVLYKGPDTVIADPSGRCAINSAHYERAAPWLATAGSGDVLAGFITGLLARGVSPFDAACTGAWLHVECALSFGPGLIAEDLPEELPKVFRALGV